MIILLAQFELEMGLLLCTVFSSPFVLECKWVLLSGMYAQSHVKREESSAVNSFALFSPPVSLVK